MNLLKLLSSDSSSKQNTNMFYSCTCEAARALHLQLPSILQRDAQRQRQKLIDDVSKTEGIQQFFVNKNREITLNCSEIFSEKYTMEDIEIALQLESVLSFTAEKTTVSTVCYFYKDDVNEEQLFCAMQQLWCQQNVELVI